MGVKEGILKKKLKKITTPTVQIKYLVYILAYVRKGNPPQHPSPPKKPYHELGVTFRQHICDKVDFFQLFYNLMQKF